MGRQRALGAMLAVVLGFFGITVGCGGAAEVALGDYPPATTIRLEALRGSQGEAAVARALAGERDDEARLQLIHALGEIGSSDTRNALDAIAANAGEDDPIRRAAREAVAAIDARAGAPADVAAARAAYLDRQVALCGNAQAEPEDRMRALNRLWFFRATDGDRVVDGLVAWNGSSAPPTENDYRSTAFEAARTIGTPQALRAVSTFALADRGWFRDQAADAFTDLRSAFPDAVDVLVAALQDDGTKLGAALMLATEGRPEVIDVLKPLLTSDSVADQRFAMVALQAVEDEGVGALARGLLGSSSDAQVLRAALAGNRVNWITAGEGEISPSFTAIADSIAGWPTELRTEALGDLPLSVRGPRPVYFRLAASDPDAAVRLLAIDLRTGPNGDPELDAAALEARELQLLLQALAVGRTPAEVTAAVDPLAFRYYEEWLENEEVCESLIDAAKRLRQADGAKAARAYLSAVGALGGWGRYQDALAIDRLANADTGSEGVVNGSWRTQLVDARAFIEALPRPRGESSVDRTMRIHRGTVAMSERIPEFDVVEQILARNQQTLGEALAALNVRQPGGDRVFLLHYHYLAPGPASERVWRALAEAPAALLAEDVRWLEPFGVAEDPYWGRHLAILGEILQRSERSVRDAVFARLGEVFLERANRGDPRLAGTAGAGIDAGLPARLLPGQLIESVALPNRAARGALAEAIVSPFEAIVRNGTDEEVAQVAAIIGLGALPADEVAQLAVVLFARDDVGPAVARGVLNGLRTGLSQRAYEQRVLPIALDALSHEDLSVRRAAARVLADNAALSTDVPHGVLRELVTATDPEVFAAGRVLMLQLVEWALSLDPSEQRGVRETISQLLDLIAGSPREELRQTAADVLGRLAKLAEEGMSPYINRLIGRANSMRQSRLNTERPLITRELARFLVAFGNQETLHTTVLELLEYTLDREVRSLALDGIGKRPAADWLDDLEVFLNREGDEDLRTKALGLYVESALAGARLEPAFWLIVSYEAFVAEEHVPFARQVLAGWMDAQIARDGTSRGTRAIEAQLAREADERGDPVLPLIIPTLAGLPPTATSLPLLRRVVGNADPARRILAAPALAEISPGTDAATVNGLLGELLADPVSSVRMAAIRAIRRAGRVGTLDALMSLTDDNLPASEATELRAAIDAIFGAMIEKLPPERVIDEVVSAIGATSDADTQIMLLGRLATIENRGRLAGLQRGFTLHAARVRVRAVELSLAADGIGAIEGAVGLLTTDPSTDVKLAVIDGLRGVMAKDANAVLAAIGPLQAVLEGSPVVALRDAALGALIDHIKLPPVSSHLLNRLEDETVAVARRETLLRRLIPSLTNPDVAEAIVYSLIIVAESTVEAELSLRRTALQRFVVIASDWSEFYYLTRSGLSRPFIDVAAKALDSDDATVQLRALELLDALDSVGGARRARIAELATEGASAEVRAKAAELRDQ